MVPPKLIRMIASHKEEQERKKKSYEGVHNDTGLVMTMDNGRYMHPMFLTRRFNEFVMKHGLPKITFHGLRHANASLLNSLDVELDTIKERMGA